MDQFLTDAVLNHVTLGALFAAAHIITQHVFVSYIRDNRVARRPFCQLHNGNVEYNYDTFICSPVDDGPRFSLADTAEGVLFKFVSEPDQVHM